MPTTEDNDNDADGDGDYDDGGDGVDDGGGDGDKQSKSHTQIPSGVRISWLSLSRCKGHICHLDSVGRNIMCGIRCSALKIPEAVQTQDPVEFFLMGPSVFV